MDASQTTEMTTEGLARWTGAGTAERSWSLRTVKQPPLPLPTASVVRFQEEAHLKGSLGSTLERESGMDIYTLPNVK